MGTDRDAVGFEFLGKFGLYKPDFHSIEKMVLFTLNDNGDSSDMYQSMRMGYIKRHPSREGCLISKFPLIRVYTSVDGSKVAKYIFNFILELGNYPRVSIFPFSGGQSGLYFDGKARVLQEEEYPNAWNDANSSCTHFRPPEHLLRHMLVVDTHSSGAVNRKLIVQRKG